MKYKYLLLVSVVLFASCSITKRKYLPGYAIEHVKKSPKAIYNNESQLSRSYIAHKAPKTLTLKDSHIPVQPENQGKHFNLVANSSVYHKNISSNIVESTDESTPIDVSKPTIEFPPDSMRAAMAARVCKQAKASQHLGMFALTLTLLSFAAWVLIQASINSSAKWATVMLATAIVSTGVIAGGILAILAIIFAIVAFHKIHLESGKYDGTGKAISGIIFAVILFGILGLLAVNLHQ